MTTSTGDRTWADMCARDHFVQFYDDDQTIVEAVAGYFAFGLRFREGCVLVGTGSHNAEIVASMREIGCDVDTAIADGQLVVLDADEMLSKFMSGDLPDGEAFHRVIGEVIVNAVRYSKPPRLFGEMVSVLMEQGRADGAVALEKLWNDLARSRQFRLFCAYNHQALERAMAAHVAAKICDSHSHV